MDIGSSFKDVFQGVLAADFSSEDPELTHLLCESLLVSDTQISPEGEEAAQSACVRLHQTVETLLDLLNQANTQVKNHMYLYQMFCFVMLPHTDIFLTFFGSWSKLIKSTFLLRRNSPKLKKTLLTFLSNTRSSWNNLIKKQN